MSAIAEIEFLPDVDGRMLIFIRRGGLMRTSAPS
jgi:hypothetical protein